MPTVQLGHTSVTTIAARGVFDGVTDVKSMCDAIFQASLEEPLLDTELLPDVDPKDKQKKFRGDAFEVFGEFLCAVTENDKRIGVKRGKMIELEDDVGVDLHGDSTIDGAPVAVQFKFKSDPAYVFTLRELATWLAASGHIFKAEGRNLILITTGQAVNRKIRQVVPNLRVINRALLRKLVDNNQGFWDDFRASLLLSRTQPKVRQDRILYPDQQEASNAITKWLA